MKVWFMAIYTSCEVKEEFSKYSGSNIKLAIVHIRLFKLILKKFNFCKEQEVVQLLMDNLQKECDCLTCMQTPMTRSLSRTSKRPGRK